jgi:dihydroxy-acid dehydratase
VLHLLAAAHAAKVKLTIDDFEEIRGRVPVLCDLKPSGRYVATDFHKAGGVPQVMRMLLDHGLVHGDALTITGRTVAEELASVPSEPRAGQDVVRPWSSPIYAHGHLVILRGNLAEEGAVAKVTGVKHPRISGPARVFDREEGCAEAIFQGRIKPGDVVVIRYEGPKGGPGMREMLSPTSAIIGVGLGDSVGLITDGRFSGATHGMVVGPRGARGRSGRRDRAHPGGRPHHDRRGQTPAAARGRCGRAPAAPGRLEAAGVSLSHGRPGQVRASRGQRRPGGRDRRSLNRT